METEFASYTIAGVVIAPGLVLSPMSGVTTSAFRRLVKELNPGSVGLLVSEFISVEGMTREGKRSLEMMRFHEMERPFSIQIFGHDVRRMRDAALMVQDAGADMLDINCGCPAPKVVKKGGGCELMRQPDHLREILSAVRSAVSIPLTVKIRSGWDDASRNAVEIAKLAESEGVDGLAVHGRTRAALYRGEADWEIVREVARSVKIPVCGSGDVVDRRSALERLSDGVQGLYIGRGALENPLIFSEITKGEPVFLRKNPELMLRILRRYVELLLEEFQPRSSVGRLKQLASQMCRGVWWSKALCRASTFEEQMAILEKAEATLHHEDEGFVEAEAASDPYSGDAA